MPSHAWMAAKLLRGAADFFRSMSETNPSISAELKTNAETCDQVADLVEKDPNGLAPSLIDEMEEEKDKDKAKVH